MSEVSKQPARVPLVDPSTGVITREWYRFFEQVFSRVGGTYSQTNNELAVDLHDDAGIEETKVDVLRLRDELGVMPPVAATQDIADMAPIGAFFSPSEDPSGRIESLEAEVIRLRQEIDALRQGATP